MSPILDIMPPSMHYCINDTFSYTHIYTIIFKNNSISIDPYVINNL